MATVGTDIFEPGIIVSGKYRVEKLIGEGGMGLVVLATHLQLDQQVALKFLRVELLAQAEIVERFLREARAAVKIRSEHVARVLDVGTLNTGAPYMVMEYLEGEDLDQVVARRGPLGLTDAVDYVLQACEAIAEAHALGIVHRDLKPANLFLAKQPGGRPAIKVLDFGISKMPASQTERALTGAASLMGSPNYMSPEQLVAAATVTFTSDVWALGVILFELASGQVPFHAETMPELVALILSSPPRALRSLRPDAAPEVDAAIARCLEKDVTRRFGNIAELARALTPFGSHRAQQSLERVEHVLGLSKSLAPPPPAGSAPARSGPVLGAATFSPTTTIGGIERSNRWIAPVALLTLLVVGIVGIVGIKQSSTPQLVAAQLSVVTSSSAASSSTQTATPSATPSIAPTPEISAQASPTAPIASGAPSRKPTSSHRPRPNSSAAPSASAKPCPPQEYYDAQGNVHFRIVPCP